MEERIIQNLKTKSGKLLFFGGVYSNLQSLEALQKWAVDNQYSPHNIFCTGDILGYCAQPVECIQLIRDWGIHSIAGNVELQIRNGDEDCGCDFKEGGRCDLFSRNWYGYTQSRMNEETTSWLHTLPHHIQFSYGGRNLIIVHGSWFQTSEFIFRSTPWEIKEANFEATGSEVIIAGHCGLPFAHAKGKNTWINAGVIGMPANDGTDRVWFVTMNEEGDNLNYEFHNYRYDNQQTGKQMRENNLPLSYATTLLTGVWDNCEILPAVETAQQGQKLQL